MLNKEQTDACQLALRGHNLLLLGQAGTGKSYTLSEIVQQLRHAGKRVALTAMTGIACQNYSHSLNCTTLHKWAGVEDGRYSNERISQLIRTDERFVNTLQSIKETDVLIIDEISMLSSRLLEQVEYVCSSVKDPVRHFGGLQLIFCGDFFQLPPVPNVMYGDDGAFAFTSKIWPRLFPHNIILAEVVRQAEDELISTINEVARGSMSAKSVSLLKSLARPLCKGPLPTKLYSSNLLVDQYNRDCIVNHTGKLYEFQSEDAGDKTILKGISAPKSLWLKVGVPVVLLRNMNDKLMNGCRGTVVDVTKDGPIVHFPACNTTTLIERKVFTVYNPRERRQLAQRTQFPLKLSYALTIHRSQGMTLDRVEVDCRGIFKPGQLGVALGRVTSIEGLRVINFSPRYCITQSDDVIEFYNQCASHPVQESLTCCRTQIRQHLTGISDVGCCSPPQSVAALCFDADCWEPFTEDIISFQNEDEMVEDEIMDATPVVDFQLPQHIDIRSMVEHLRIQEVMTHLQEQINIELDKITTDHLERLIRFCICLWSSLCEIYERTVPGDKIASRHWSSFYAEYHKLTTGGCYNQWCKQLFSVGTLASSHLNVCYMISVALRKRFLQLESEEVLNNPGEAVVKNQRQVVNSLVDGARGKIRYVGGYCVAKLRKDVYKALQALLYQTSVESQHRLKIARASLDLIECLSSSELTLLQCSSDQGSLHETSRKQNSRRGLTNISDKTYDFFTILCRKILFVQSIANMHIHGEGLQILVNTTLQNDADLFTKWSRIFDSNVESFDTFDNTSCITSEVRGLLSDLTYKVEVIHLLFNEIVQLYSQVLLNQLRKDYLAKTQEKKLAHRQQVMTNKGQAKTSIYTYAELINDTSINKQVSHYLMKGNSLKNHTYFEDSKMKKKEIRTICICYGVNLSTKDTRSTLIGKLVPVLNHSDSMPFPYYASDKNTDQAEQNSSMEIETSTADHIPMELDGSVEDEASGETEEGSDEGCMECSSVHGDMWISCDWCNGWMHRNCAGLADNKRWKWYFNTNEDSSVCDVRNSENGEITHDLPSSCDHIKLVPL